MPIRVIARIRPQQKSELAKDVIVSTDTSGNTCQPLLNSHHHESNEKPKQRKPSTAPTRPNVVKIPNPKNEGESFAFQFSGVYDGSSSQQDVFENEVVPTIKPLFAGLDVTVFAYGSTGTGKTYTMRGGKSLADRGIIPRLLSGIYRRARKVDKDSEGQTHVDITLSYYEIYNDKVFDLFEAPEKRSVAGLPIRDNCGKTVVVGLTEKPCGSLKEFEKLYDQANINRSTSATKLNAVSSRSHAILAIKLTVTSGEEVRISTASAIDLAGSEDNRRTENGKERMVESASINRSLFTLAKCVEAISQNQTRIPYRESKMTRILSLGQNNGLTIMILNLAPTRSYHLDTLSSLNFANRTKKIEVREVENEPIFKGCARGLPTVMGDTMKRQPLRPLTSAMHNSAANNVQAGSKQNQKPKTFTVYSDRSSVTGARSTRLDVRKHTSPLKRPLDSTESSIARPVKRRSLPRPSRKEQSLLSKQVIEDMIERKVADALAARALDQAPTAIEPEISEEVRKRLDLIERRIQDQESTGREQGLTFLLCAKQHAVRGEDRSALKMYELAKDYFPNNQKLIQKIEKLQAKVQGVREREDIGQEHCEDNVAQKGFRKSNPDEDYHDTEDYANDDDDDDPIQRVKRKKQRKVLEQQSITLPTTQGTETSPHTKRLLQIIDSRDVAQISLLRGVGPKRAESIVDALNRDAVASVHSLTQLGRLKGIGSKMVENMRAGLEARG